MLFFTLIMVENVFATLHLNSLLMVDLDFFFQIPDYFH